MNGHTAHKNELAAALGPCAVDLRDISQNIAGLGTPHTGFFL